MTTIQHYSAENARTSLLHHAVRVGDYPAMLVRRHSLLWNFFRRDLLGRFKGSALGIFWVLIQPVFMFCVYFAIFGILFAPRDDPAGGPNPAFAMYLFAGILSFGAINESTSTALGSILGSANLVKKVKFPCEMLPLVPVLVSMVVYIVGCGVLLIAGLAFGEVRIGLDFLWWPVLIVVQLVFATGVGLLLAGANVFLRDIGHLYRIFATAWFFLTPNFWRLDMVESTFSGVGAGWVANALLFNPALPMVLAQRQVFGIGHTWSDELYAGAFPFSLPVNIALSFAWAAFALVLGYGFFKSRRHKFADLV